MHPLYFLMERGSQIILKTGLQIVIYYILLLIFLIKFKLKTFGVVHGLVLNKHTLGLQQSDQP